MLRGAIVALILGLIFVLGNFLFRVLPSGQRKIVAAGLIVLGLLMMLTNFPYSYGLIEQSNSADIAFLALLFGGGLVAGVGLVLLRLNRESGESGQVIEDEKTGSIWAWLVLGPIGLILVGAMSIFVLPGLLGGTDKSVAKEKKEVTPARSMSHAEFEKTVPTIDSIDQALGYLAKETKDERTLACSYLSQVENFDAERRIEVCEALMKVPQGYAVIPFQAAKALKQWVGPEAIPRLKQELERSADSNSFEPLVELYANQVGVEAAPFLVEKLADGGQPHLEKIGPEAEEFVLPYMNSYNNSERLIARKLLTQWGTDGDFLIRQCLEDIESPHDNTSDPAKQFMADFSGQIDSKLQSAVAAKFENFLLDENYYDKKQIVQLMGKYPGKNTARALVDFMKTYKRSPGIDSEVVKSLANLDSELAIEGIVFAFFDGRATNTTTNALIANGSKGSETVAQKMVEQLDNASPGFYSKAIGILEKVDGGIPVLIEKCTRLFDSKDEKVIEVGMRLLGKCSLDPLLQPKVCPAISKAINSIPLSTKNAALIRATCVTSKVWGDETVAASLNKFAEFPDSMIKRQIRSTTREIMKRTQQLGTKQ